MDPLKHPSVKLFTKSKKHFFSIVEKAGGEALLTSKAYSSKKSRDNGIHNLIKNLDNLQKKAKDKKEYFVIKSGNNQLLAKSRLFSSAREMEEAMDFISVLFESKKEEPVKKPIAAEDKRQEPVIEKTGSIDLPPKYSFRLEFYFSDTDGPLRGKIEYPFKKEKQTFEGIDMPAIESFLMHYLPKKGQKKVNLPVNTPEDVPVEETIVGAGEARKPQPLKEKERVLAPAAKPVMERLPEQQVEASIKAMAIPASSTINFDFIDWKTGRINNFNLNKEVQAGAQIDLSKLKFSRDIYTEVAITIFGMSLDTKQKVLVGKTQLKTANLSTVKIPLFFTSIPSFGVHKFDVVVKLTASGKGISPFHLVGAKMTNLYE